MKKTILQRRYKTIMNHQTNRGDLMLFYIRMRNYSKQHPSDFLIPRFIVRPWSSQQICPIPRNHFMVLLRNPKLILRLKPLEAFVAIWYLHRSGKDAISVIDAWNAESKKIFDPELLKHKSLYHFKWYAMPEWHQRWYPLQGHN